MPTFDKVADVNEIPDGGRKSVIVDELPALLISDRGPVLLHRRCLHTRRPAAHGRAGRELLDRLSPGTGARFDLATGNALCMPATEAVRTFAVEVREDGVYADVEG